jgi:hypothetical protein
MSELEVSEMPADPTAEDLRKADWYVILHDLQAVAPMMLGPGIELRPLDMEIEIWDLASAGSVGFRE